ncbi:Crp/Fnr family transcriptional regulator [Chitinophaga qingshengii]|uniref:Crp/Fnr family transcriptional regulator n=1 Tax=Chitinophaga qingshengii TaxID=1569794 RepID=A0ABR7TUS6_9BACT|nr:Crp/Fnr family transcriptional regulator [Chitinophaga qingshengii]MBC9934236.1 Crp/Fnr family transcriptional regulator [Chitinophaga qingshengii]
MHETLIKYIKQYVPITASDIALIEEAFTYRKMEKGELLLKNEEICRHQNFVLKGFMKTYHVSPTGNEHCILLVPAEKWVADLNSYLNQAPSTVIIKAITNTEVLQLSKPSFDCILDKSPSLERFFRKMYQDALCAHHKKIIDTLTLPAKARYINFMKIHPDIVQFVPLKDIASYLGMTPEYLSSLRRQNIKKR